MTTQCKFVIENRTPGKRYVNWRNQCRREVRHESGYCHQHRWDAPGYDPFGKKRVSFCAQNCADSSRFSTPDLYQSMTYGWVVVSLPDLAIVNP